MNENYNNHILEYGKKLFIKNALESLQEAIDFMEGIEDNKRVDELTKIYKEIEEEYLK